MQKKNNTELKPSGRKRRIQRLENQSEADRILVATIGDGLSMKGSGLEPGDFVVMKLNFTPADLTPGRLVVFKHRQVPGLLTMKIYKAANNQYRFVALNPDYEDLYYDREDVVINAVVMRVDRVVWEHGKRQKAGKPKTASPEKMLDELRRRLESIEFLPENEAVRFQLMTEIHRLESKLSDDEWPEVIGNE